MLLQRLSLRPLLLRVGPLGEGLTTVWPVTSDTRLPHAEKNTDVMTRMKNELENWLVSVPRSDRGEDYPEGKVLPPLSPLPPETVPAP